MPSLMIQPTRTEITRSFPVLGFTIRTGESPAWFEVAIASHPGLFEAQSRGQRTMTNFYSSRVSGPLPAEHGEATYLVPQAVLDRFSGQDRLYYALAVYKQAEFRNPHLITPPKEAAPSVFISKSYSGVGRRLAVRPTRRGGANDRDGGYIDERPESLAWGGDEAIPGKSEPVSVTPAKGSGTAAAPTATAHAADLAYDDGYDPVIWERGMAEDAAAADDEHGIDGPIPDTDAASQALTLTASEYPQASRFEPADPGNYRVSSTARTISRVVIHITDGGRNINGTIGWFKNPAAKVSAHYVIGQNGEVVQMVAHNDIAWHASHANGDSIGIEHVASRSRGIMPTQDEYCASAALVSWLCQKFSIPVDRQHILGHSDADPGTTHAGCPNSVWNWDYYMDLVTSGQCKPMPDGAGAAAQSMGVVRQLDAGQSFDCNWPDVRLRNQTTDTNCWATAAAIVAGWAAQDPNYPIRDTPEPTGIDDAAKRYDLEVEPPQSFPFTTFRQILETKGPIWVSADQPFASGPGFHAVVITGMYSDGAPDGSDTYLKILDPWDREAGTPGHPGKHTGTHATGSTYIISWTDFLNEFENAVRNEPGWMWVRLMHAHDTGGRRPSTGASALSLAIAQSLEHAAASHPAHKKHLHAHARALAGERSFDCNWPDVKLRNQTTDDNCWATAAAIVAGWATQDPNYPIKDTPEPTGIDDAARRYDLDVEPPASFPFDGFRRILETKGPIWVSADQPFASGPGFHAVVITGMYSDGAPDGSDTYLKILDPWDRAPGTPGHPGKHTGTHTTGSTYIISWTDFLTEFENAVRNEPGWLWVRLMHAHDTGGRRPSSGASALSLAMAAVAGHSPAPAGTMGTSHVLDHHRLGARTMAGPAAAVGAAIAGIAINRIEDKQGAVSWHLDQWPGPKRPWDREQYEGAGVWQHHTTNVVGPRLTMLAGTKFGADFEVEWDSNGSSIRNIVVSAVGTDDWALASLDVQGRIVDEPNAFTFPGDTTPVSALHVRFDYHFHLHLQSDRFCISNLTLYGNGQTGATYDWWRTS